MSAPVCLLADGVERLTLAAAVQRLASPAPPTWSVLTGTAVLVVDATDTDAWRDENVCTHAAARLRVLPCPSVMLTAEPPTSAASAWLDAFDVVVTTRPDRDAVTAAIVRAPLAAATLMHVLRAGTGLALADALTLESLGYASLQAGPEHERWLRGRAPTGRLPDERDHVVAVARAGDGLVITLDHPARHNAFSVRMRDELHAALSVAEADSTLRVVLRGAGPSFSSGGDLDEFGSRPDPATAHVVRMTRSPARLLATLGARVRAEVHGACIGAGVELAAFAGHVLAAPDAFFQLPEVSMGLIPGAGGTVSVARRIGRQRTGFLALTGQRLDATTALAWGLVDAIAERAPGASAS